MPLKVCEKFQYGEIILNYSGRIKVIRRVDIRAREEGQNHKGTETLEAGREKEM
jgi:hypothetical protein